MILIFEEAEHGELTFGQDSESGLLMLRCRCGRTGAGPFVFSGCPFTQFVRRNVQCARLLPTCSVTRWLICETSWALSFFFRSLLVVLATGLRKRSLAMTLIVDCAAVHELLFF